MSKRQRSTISRVRASALRILRKQPVHLFRCFQKPIGMPLTIEADAVDGGAVADAGDDVLQLPAAWVVKQDVVGDDRFHLVTCRHIRQLMEPQAIVRATARAERNVGPVSKDRGDLPELAGGGLVGLIRDKNGNQAAL